MATHSLFLSVWFFTTAPFFLFIVIERIKDLNALIPCKNMRKYVKNHVRIWRLCKRIERIERLHDFRE